MSFSGKISKVLQYYIKLYTGHGIETRHVRRTNGVCGFHNAQGAELNKLSEY